MSVRVSVVLVLGALGAAGAAFAGCVVGDGLDSQSGQPEDAAGSDPSEASPAYDGGDASVREPWDARLAPDTPPGDASADAGTDADADADTEANVDALAGDDADACDDGAGDAAEAGDDRAGDASADVPSSDAPSDAGADAGNDSGCVAPPQITILTPASGASISVSRMDPSTYFFPFGAHVDFCVPMQSVTFDYLGPAGLVLQQEMTFNSYADPFAQNTRVGGSASSLAAHNGGQSPSSWTFYVTATDANKQTTVAQETFTLVVKH